MRVYTLIIVMGLRKPERQELWTIGNVVKGVKEDQDSSDNMGVALRGIHP